MVFTRSMKRRLEEGCIVHDDAVSPSERQKTENNSPKLTDLNDNCLASIFKHLNLTDLMNIAKSSERFVEEARWAAKCRFHEKTVRIDASSILIVDENFNGWMSIMGRIDFRQGTKSKVSKFLEQFGHLILKLEVDCLRGRYSSDEDIQYYKAIWQFISKYCSKTLLDLTLKINPDFHTSVLMNDINEPFENLKNLQIVEGELGRIRRFNKWFPELRSLTLLRNSVSTGGENCIHVNFPKLKELSIDIDAYGGFKEMDIGAAIRLNPQLRALRITGRRKIGFEDGFFHFIDKHLKKLEHLQLPSDFNVLQPDECKTIENIKKLTSRIFPKFKFTCLEELELIAIGDDEIGKLCDYQISGIVKLSLTYYPYKMEHLQNDHHLSKLIFYLKSLPKLSELNLTHFPFSVDGLVQILAECKSLKKFRWFLYSYCDSKQNYEEYLHANYGNEWKWKRCKYVKQKNPSVAMVIDFFRK